MAETLVGGDHWAIFGDGNMAQIISNREYYKKSTTGKKFTKFIFIPSKRIIQMYNVEPDLQNMDIKEYHWTKVVWLERGVTRSRCLILSDYTGGDTPLTRRYSELNETIEDMEQMVRSSQSAKSRAYEELDIERQQKYLAVKTQVRILTELAKARGKPRNDDGGDEGYEGEGPM